MNSASKVFKVIVPLLLAAASIFVLTGYAVSPELHAGTIASLDEKKTTVMELTAASTAAAAVVSALPDDTGTPIAEQLTDLSGYFLIVLSAIYLEKYLTTLSGYAAFTVLIPLACVIFSANVFFRDNGLRNLWKKLLIVALAVLLIIPASAKVSDLIEDTYGESINATIDTAMQSSDTLNSSKEAEETTGLRGIITTVKDSVNDVVTQAKTLLNRFIEALAVMIVTSCIIPVLVLLFMIWLVKFLAGVNINLPRLPRRSGNGHSEER